jgi:vacuolar-type H+-ATPase subunit I/STV1
MNNNIAKILPSFSHPANKWAKRMKAILEINEIYWEEDDASVKMHILRSVPEEIFETMPNELSGFQSLNWLEKYQKKVGKLDEILVERRKGEEMPSTFFKKLKTKLRDTELKGMSEEEMAELCMQRVYASLPQRVKQFFRITKEREENIDKQLEMLDEEVELCNETESERKETHRENKVYAIMEDTNQANGAIMKKLDELTREMAKMKLEMKNTKEEICQTCKKPGHSSQNCRSQSRQTLTCYKCGKTGHFMRDCFQGKYENNQQQGTSRNSGRREQNQQGRYQAWNGGNNGRLNW